MAKDSTAASASQIPDNPQVLIRYSPENAPLALAKGATAMLARIQTAKAITNPKQLESVSEIINEAQITSEEVEQFIGSLREKIQAACNRVREIDGYEDFEATLTIRKWSLRQLLNDGIGRMKGMRAQFLSDEKERVNRAQLAKQAEQDRINKKAADDAAKAAKAAGASRETIADIKENVMATPAPIVESKAANVAQEMGAGLRYSYTAQITSLKSFLGTCLNNQALFNTLAAAVPDIEKAFRKMASDQKEAFAYPGITFRKTPIDVSRRA